MSYRSLFNKIINLFFFSFTFSFYLRVKRRAYNSIHCVFLLHFYGNHDFLSYKLWFKKVETINLDNPHLDFLLHFLLAWPFSTACQRNVYFPHLKVDSNTNTHRHTNIWHSHIKKIFVSCPFIPFSVLWHFSFFFFIPFLYKSTKLCCVLK